jgi:hypothetical protein
MEQKLNATLAFSGALKRTIRCRIQAQLKFLNIHIFVTILLRLVYGPDQLTRHIHTPSLTLIPFKAQPIVPDQLVRLEPSANITELSSDTFEEELPSPPYARLYPKAGLTKPELPSSINPNLPNDESTILKMRNQTVLITYDLATNTREVRGSFDD